MLIPHINNNNNNIHKSAANIKRHNKYMNMYKFSDIVDGDLTEYETDSDTESTNSEDSDISEGDHTEGDESTWYKSYTTRCNRKREKLKTKKKEREIDERAKASIDSFVCQSSEVELDMTSLQKMIDDTMSCVIGTVTNGINKINGSQQDHLFCTVTDTGTSLPLIQKQYAEALGLKFFDLKSSERFDIAGAGGGKERIVNYTILEFTLPGHKITSVSPKLEIRYISDTTQLKFRHKFYVIENLKVPSLWGGPEARRLQLTDLHQHRGMTIKAPRSDDVYFIESKSFTHMTLEDMTNDDDQQLSKVWNQFIPNKYQLSQLVRGAESWNAAAILAPFTSTVINVVDDKGRFSKSTNVCLVNQEDVDALFGSRSVDVIDSFCENRAQIVLHNHTRYKLNLDCGAFRVKVNPVIAFPVINLVNQNSDVDLGTIESEYEGLPKPMSKDDGRPKYEGDLEYHQKWPMKEDKAYNGNDPSMERKRPDKFPEHLWELVDPWEKDYVIGRFEKFKPERLDFVVNEIITKLDIEKRDEKALLPWMKVEASEEDILRAQALANLDAYFYSNEDDVKAHNILADIELKPTVRPFKCRPRRYSQVQQAFLEAKTGSMVEEGKLEFSTSDWSHGLVLVPYEERINAFMEEFGEAAMTEMSKKEHRARVSTFFRLCLDLRQLNNQTVPDVYPLPRIDDLLDHIPRKCDRFSISDLADAFFLIEVKKEKRHLTAFRTHNRQLQFAALPQGFINSPAIFSRFVDRMFDGLDRSRFSWYMDDTLNHIKGFQNHYFTQREAYNRLRIGNITMKLTKTHLNYRQMKFLGHLLTEDGRTPAPDAVEAILEWANPKDATAVRSFLGSTLYYREYIHQYSDLAMPLYDLTKKGVIVADVWNDKHEKAAQYIKDALTSKPVLLQIDNTKPFRLIVDACRKGHGLGAILEQPDNDGRWHPVAYYSKSLKKAEREYSATELECKILHDAILH